MPSFQSLQEGKRIKKNEKLHTETKWTELDSLISAFCLDKLLCWCDQQASETYTIVDYQLKVDQGKLTAIENLENTRNITQLFFV